MSPSRAMARPHGDPRLPLNRHHADDVGQVLASEDGPLLDRDPSQGLQAVLSALGSLATHSTTGGYFIKRAVTAAVL